MSATATTTAPPRPGPMARIRRLARKLTGKRKKPFSTSGNYWEERYKLGGNSGEGSYGRLAQFKAKILNDFVEREGIQSVLEFGCGDGAQLSLAEYPSYTGLDVAHTAVEMCSKKFRSDSTKSFRHHDPASFEAGATVPKADLAMSLDVIFHLVEDQVFDTYMSQLFDSANRFVIVYSSNRDERPPHAKHVRHHKFTDWVEANRADWELVRHEPNRFPETLDDGQETSFADFYFFAPRGGASD